MNKSKIPTIIGLFVLIAGVGLGVLLVNRQQIFRLGAAPELVPKDVKVSNVTDDSFAVTWITDKAALGALSWGETGDVGTLATESTTNLQNVHSVTLTGLSEGRSYFFKINSGGVEFDNDGVPWSATTAPSLTENGTGGVLTGTITTQTGSGAFPVIVYVTGAGVSPQSTITSQNGNWAVNLANARGADLNSFANVSSSDDLEILVQGGPLGIASAQLSGKSAGSVPPISLGKTHDFTNVAEEETENPDSLLTLPTDEEEDLIASGGFNVGTSSATQSSTIVTVDSIDNKEVIFTDTPEIFGKAPAGTTITITIQSDPVTATVKAASNGTWKFTPPESLPEGTHTLTVSWRDQGGILRTLTRSFTVNASEGDPAFESTPSAGTSTPRPTTTATPRLSPTPTASGSATLNPSATPLKTKTPTPTAEALPSAGVGIPTVALVFLGVLLIVVGIATNITD